MKTTQKTTKNANPTRLARLDDATLCRRCDRLGNLAWTYRAKGWNRKLEQTLADLRTALIELNRRIEPA